MSQTNFLRHYSYIIPLIFSTSLLACSDDPEKVTDSSDAGNSIDLDSGFEMDSGMSADAGMVDGGPPPTKHFRSE